MLLVFCKKVVCMNVGFCLMFVKQLCGVQQSLFFRLGCLCDFELWLFWGYSQFCSLFFSVAAVWFVQFLRFLSKQKLLVVNGAGERKGPASTITGPCGVLVLFAGGVASWHGCCFGWSYCSCLSSWLLCFSYRYDK